MSKQMKWGLATLILLLGIAAVFIFLDQNAELQQLEKETAESDKLRQEHNKPQEMPPQKAHVHADGSRHEGQHHDPIETSPPPEFTPASIQIPEGITDPDVAAAWERLDYIAKNPYAWGGVFSPRATELIAELMPPPALMDEAHGEQVQEQIEELIAQGDPRAAAVLIANMCDGYIGGRPMTDALEEIGPPAMPYLLLYLEKDIAQEKEIMVAGMYDALGRIGARYRADLGGIVDHIIIPKLEVVAADDHDEDFDEKYARFSASVIFAREALARLQ